LHDKNLAGASWDSAQTWELWQLTIPYCQKAHRGQAAKNVAFRKDLADQGAEE